MLSTSGLNLVLGANKYERAESKKGNLRNVDGQRILSPYKHLSLAEADIGLIRSYVEEGHENYFVKIPIIASAGLSNQVLAGIWLRFSKLLFVDISAAKYEFDVDQLSSSKYFQDIWGYAEGEADIVCEKNGDMPPGFFVEGKGQFPQSQWQTPDFVVFEITFQKFEPALGSWLPQTLSYVETFEMFKKVNPDLLDIDLYLARLSDQYLTKKNIITTNM